MADAPKVVTHYRDTNADADASANAYANVMFTLTLVALYSTGGKAGDACTRFGGKCNAARRTALKGKPYD